jgi:hypothetical protein
VASLALGPGLISPLRKACSGLVDAAQRRTGYNSEQEGHSDLFYSRQHTRAQSQGLPPLLHRGPPKPPPKLFSCSNPDFRADGQP